MQPACAAVMGFCRTGWWVRLAIGWDASEAAPPRPGAGLAVQLPGCLAAWLPGCLAAWLPGCLAAWLPGYLATWLGCLPGCLAELATCLTAYL